MKKALFLLALLCMPVTATARTQELVNMGEFRITAYCPCDECSEGYGRRTSTGTHAVSGRTIAVDPEVISYGTEIVIDGHVYVAEDCGGMVNGDHIDIFFDTHEEVEEFEVQHKTIWILRSGR